ncbi:GNAT family N-acetyltransferase [Pedobacter antarcticus]|uniref:GNAT family N-acetyltransferase n=1 Tax=Pedobacter antarcticus TaxID=34086 RepID=UPI00292CCA15|nr:GNAT family N-acetyltransferase [Pedobacter antarcticus]
MRKTTIIHDDEYEIVSAYRDNKRLRYSFNDLTQQTYKFDFENWFNLGYWGENYIPYSLVKDDKIVANVSVNIIDFDIQGDRRQYIQIGTVMTDKDYRNLGLSRFLMELVISEWESETDLIYLFANNTVLDFYPKFGFQSISEYEYTRSAPFRRTDREVIQLDMSDAAARQTLYDMADKSVISAKLSMLNNANLVLFYCTSFMRDQVFYVPDLHAIVIAEFETESCYLHDIFCREQISVDEIINSIVRSNTKKVVLGFAPAESSAYDIEILTTEPDTLFVKPGIAELFNRELLRFPVLSHA